MFSSMVLTRCRYLSCVLFLMCVTVTATLVLFKCDEDGRVVRSDGRFQQLALALRNYHNDYGEFPPATAIGVSGHACSWRVLILPYLEDGVLSHSYDSGIAWNSGTNYELTCRPMPAYFESPFSTSTLPNTGYTTIPDGNSRSSESKPGRSLFVKEQGDLFIIVEVKNSGVHWMEPRDVLPGE